MAIATGQGFCLRYIVGENEISGYAGRFPFAGVLLGSLFESLGQGLIHAARFEQDVEVLEQELFGFCISWGNSSQRLESCNLALRIIITTANKHMNIGSFVLHSLHGKDRCTQTQSPDAI